MRLYASAADHLTYRPYRIRTVEAAARLPLAVATGEVHPIYDILDPKRETLASKTILDMCELLANRVPFTIIDDRDILLIAQEIEAYLEQTRTMPRDDELRQFLAKLLPLREQILRLQRRVFKKHPDWASKFLGLDSGYLKLLYQFMRSAGLAVGDSTDPREAMQQLDRRVSGGGPAMPSLQEQLASVEQKKRIAEQYQENPAQLYDTGLD